MNILITQWHGSKIGFSASELNTYLLTTEHHCRYKAPSTWFMIDDLILHLTQPLSDLWRLDAFDVTLFRRQVFHLWLLMWSWLATLYDSRSKLYSVVQCVPFYWRHFSFQNQQISGTCLGTSILLATYSQSAESDPSPGMLPEAIFLRPASDEWFNTPLL